jgi:hypothetical protein
VAVGGAYTGVGVEVEGRGWINVGVGDGVCVGVAVGVCVAVDVGVSVIVDVGVGVDVAVCVAVGVGEGVGVTVAVAVIVTVGSSIGVGSGRLHADRLKMTEIAINTTSPANLGHLTHLYISDSPVNTNEYGCPPYCAKEISVTRCAPAIRTQSQIPA